MAQNLILIKGIFDCTKWKTIVTNWAKSLKQYEDALFAKEKYQGYTEGERGNLGFFVLGLRDSGIEIILQEFSTKRLSKQGNFWGRPDLFAIIDGKEYYFEAKYVPFPIDFENESLIYHIAQAKSQLDTIEEARGSNSVAMIQIVPYQLEKKWKENPKAINQFRTALCTACSDMRDVLIAQYLSEKTTIEDNYVYPGIFLLLKKI